jgi:enoyl-CoA hydratase
MTANGPAPSETLTVTDLDQVRILTLNRPERRNALSPDLIGAIEYELSTAYADDGVRVVIFTGNGTAFCAGLDLQAYFDVGADRTMTGRVLRSVAAFPKPTIAAVNGTAVTAGLELALNCDFIVAARSATFRDTHGKVGAYAGGGAIGRLPQGVGIRNAKYLSFTAEPLTAEQGFTLGLVSKLVDDGAALDGALEAAALIVAADPIWVQSTKESYEGAYRALASAGLDAEFSSNARGRWRTMTKERSARDDPA